MFISTDDRFPATVEVGRRDRYSGSDALPRRVARAVPRSRLASAGPGVPQLLLESVATGVPGRRQYRRAVRRPRCIPIVERPESWHHLGRVPVDVHDDRAVGLSDAALDEQPVTVRRPGGGRLPPGSVLFAD